MDKENVITVDTGQEIEKFEVDWKQAFFTLAYYVGSDQLSTADSFIEMILVSPTLRLKVK
jgi:hypothetical protein